MKKSTLTRIGGFAAAISLTATMTACAGGQSVAEACKIASDEVNKAATSVSSDMNSAIQNAAKGQKVDFGAMFQPITDSLDSAAKKITNAPVKKQLQEFTNEYKSFVDTLKGFDVSGMANLDPTDPNALSKLQEMQQKTQQLASKVQSASTRLTNQSNKLQQVCNKG